MRKAFLLLFLASFFSCGGATGSFAIKGVFDDTYKKITPPLELPSSKKYHWLYQFDSPPGSVKIAVFVKKKLLVPVDVDTHVEKFDPTTRHLYGTIEGYTPGNYEIIIVKVEKNEIIDRLPFKVYME